MKTKAIAIITLCLFILSTLSVLISLPIPISVYATSPSVTYTQTLDATSIFTPNYFWNSSFPETASPYYRGGSEDWGWNHTYPLGNIVSAALTIMAWDVDVSSERDEISVEGFALGNLMGSDGSWYSTTFAIDPAILTDGELNVWMDIDADDWGNRWVTLANSILMIEYAPTIPATINIEPYTLNLESNGQWITAYISLEGNSVEAIDVTTVTLSVASLPPPEPEPEPGPEPVPDPEPADLAPTEESVTEIQAEWGEVQDGVLMVKFSRASVIDALGTADCSSDTGDGDLVELIITGNVDGTSFTGSDWVRVISRGK